MGAFGELDAQIEMLAGLGIQGSRLDEFDRCTTKLLRDVDLVCERGNGVLRFNPRGRQSGAQACDTR